MNASLVRRGALLATLLTLVCGLALLAAAGAVAAAGKKEPAVRTVTSWPFVDPYGSFAESLALGRDGKLYASVTTWGDVTDVGQIVRIDPRTGAQTPFGGMLESPGLLTGLAFDDHGRLYVAEATFSDDPAPGVCVDAHGTPTRVLTLPAESFPNGLAFRDGALYVSNSELGAVWRFEPGPGVAAPEAPWLEDASLSPGGGPDPQGLGANGLAFRGDDLLVAVSDAGRIVKVQVEHHGAPGKVDVVAEQLEFVGADGLDVDTNGTLWITTNHPGSGRLLGMDRHGRLTVVADQPGWLDYPTQPVLADARGPKDTLYVANGSFDNGVPSVVALERR